VNTVREIVDIGTFMSEIEDADFAIWNTSIEP
jgi:hypothetical protein